MLAKQPILYGRTIRSYVDHILSQLNVAAIVLLAQLILWRSM